jgi:hypothetical protein
LSPSFNIGMVCPPFGVVAGQRQARAGSRVPHALE